MAGKPSLPPFFVLEKLNEHMPRFFNTIGDPAFWKGLVNLVDDETVINLTQKLLKRIDNYSCAEGMCALFFAMVCIYNYALDLSFQSSLH